MKAPAERLEAVTGRNPPFGTNVEHFIAMDSFLKLVAETGSRSVVPRKARSRSGLQSKLLVIYLMSPKESSVGKATLTVKITMINSTQFNEKSFGNKRLLLICGDTSGKLLHWSRIRSGVEKMRNYSHTLQAKYTSAARKRRGEELCHPVFKSSGDSLD
jgi:hypothetical protein